MIEELAYNRGAVVLRIVNPMDVITIKSVKARIVKKSGLHSQKKGFDLEFTSRSTSRLMKYEKAHLFRNEISLKVSENVYRDKNLNKQKCDIGFSTLLSICADS